MEEVRVAELPQLPDAQGTGTIRLWSTAYFLDEHQSDLSRQVSA